MCHIYEALPPVALLVEVFVQHYLGVTGHWSRDRILAPLPYPLFKAHNTFYSSITTLS